MLIMGAGKKPAATVIMTKVGKIMDKPQSEGAEQESDELDIAAEEFLQAVEKKDAKATKEALKSFVQMCMDQYESEDSESESE